MRTSAAVLYFALPYLSPDYLTTEWGRYEDHLSIYPEAFYWHTCGDYPVKVLAAIVQIFQRIYSHYHRVSSQLTGLLDFLNFSYQFNLHEGRIHTSRGV